MLCLKMCCRILCSLLCEKVTNMYDTFCTKYCNCIYNCILKPINRNKCAIIKFLQNKGQKLLTLVDIGTDIRTCYLMYNINPYWYTIMLSAILTPFIVFWASSYNFKNVTNNLQIANKDKSFGYYIYSCYLALLSFPVIGIIFTITEIIGFYILDFMLPLIQLFCLDECSLVSFWINRLDKFKESDSIEFFTICELFFESIPQVLLQLWIFILYPKTFTDSNGNSYLTTYDISISLGSAFLNIAMNVYRLKKKSSEFGLNIRTYIPYFMGSQLDKAISDGISVKNWHVSNRYSCNLSKMTFIYQTDIPDIIQEKDYVYNIHKRLILPITNKCQYNSKHNIYDCMTKRNESIKLFRFLGKHMNKKTLNVDIDCDTLNEYELSIPEIDSIKYFLSCNYHDTTFLTDWKKYCKCVSRHKLPLIYKHSITKSAWTNRIHTKMTDLESREYRTTNLIKSLMKIIVNLFNPLNIHVMQSKNLIFLNLIAFYADELTLNIVIKFLRILRGDLTFDNCHIEIINVKWKFLRYHYSNIINKVIEMLILAANNGKDVAVLEHHHDGPKHILPKNEISHLKWLSDEIISRLWIIPQGMTLYHSKMKPRIETIKFSCKKPESAEEDDNICLDLEFNSETKSYLLNKLYLESCKDKDISTNTYYKFVDNRKSFIKTSERGEATQLRLIHIDDNNWIMSTTSNKSVLSLKVCSDNTIDIKFVSLRGYVGCYPKSTVLSSNISENLDYIPENSNLDEIKIEK